MTAPSKWLRWTPKTAKMRTDINDSFAENRQTVGSVSSLIAHVREGDDLAERIEERAAIIEHDAGYDRDDADRLAEVYETIPDTLAGWQTGMDRLHAMTPVGISESRWRAFLIDADAFMERWSDKAAACRWFALDIFGVHLKAPMTRFDVGLVWLLHGHAVVDLDEAGATIETYTRARQRFYRQKSYSAGTGPAWALPCVRCLYAGHGNCEG